MRVSGRVDYTPRERLKGLFDDGGPNEPAVCLHTWGRYPFDFFDEGRAWEEGRTERFAEVYERFWREFPCDWLHVCEGPARYAPATKPPPAPPLSPEDVHAWIRENLDGQTFSKEEVLACGMYRHVERLSARLGPSLMIFPNQGAPGSGFPQLSWEDQLILIQQQPDLVAHFVEADDDRFLQRVLAARDCGADGYIFSEGYTGACDLISPDAFARVFLEPKRRFYEAVRAAGLYGIGYFLGGIMPYLDTINRMAVDGVMIEENKKGFVLDPAEVRKRLEPRIVLFGNLDSCLLLRGAPGEIRDEVDRQARARDYGKFVIANGSPICPGTPPENLRAFLDAARGS